MSQLDRLLEAERSDTLTPKGKALLDEARKRGLVPGQAGALQRGLESFNKFLDNLTDEAIGQGLLFGFGDELSAAFATYTPGGKRSDKSYQENLAEIRAKAKRFREEHPVASTAAAVAGGLPAMATGMQVARTVAPEIAKRIPTYLKATGAGAGVGGAYGFGAGEGGLEERTESAVTGAGLGGVTGAVAYPAVRAGQKVYSKAGELIKGRVAPQRAARTVFKQAMERDETTPARLQARLRDLGPQATIADVGGENLLGVARAAASVPGPAKARAATVLTGRAEGEIGRIGKKITQTLDPIDYYVAEDTFLNNLRERATPLYERAYRQGRKIISPKLESMLERPIMKKGIREATDLAAIEGREIAPQTSLEFVDDVKRGLDSLIAKETNDLTGRLTKRGALIARLKKQMLNEVDRLNPAYAKARKAYAGDAEMIEALRDGRNFLKRDPEQITRALAGMSDAAKKAYRSGAARSLMDTIEKTPDMASAARRIFSNSMIRRKLRAVMPDKQSYTDLAKTLTAETRFAQTRGKVLGGSPTQPRLAEQADLERSLGNIGAVLGSELPIAGHALVKAGIGRRIAAGTARAVPERSVELSRMLLSRNPAMNQKALEDITRLYGPRAPEVIAQAVSRALAEYGGLRAAPAIASYRR